MQQLKIKKNRPPGESGFPSGIPESYFTAFAETLIERV